MKKLSCIIIVVLHFAPIFGQYKKLAINDISPESISKTDINQYFIDFGKAWFGTISLQLPDNDQNDEITIRLGEKSTVNRQVDMDPGGTIRHFETNIQLQAGRSDYELQIPDFSPPAWGKNYYIPLPDHVPQVMPFRYCEIEGLEYDLKAENITLHAVHYPFDDSASYFHCSDTILNQIWDLCKHSIKATTFCGIYVDGDRERRPYEADAYINQLGHYCIDDEYALSRHTLEYFFDYPTWPTEWQFHTIFMAWQDYMYTGNTNVFEEYYGDLVYRSLMALQRPDGLISTYDTLLNKKMQELLHFPKGVFIRDLVDWPPSERDNYDLKPYNTVINAFYYQTLLYMKEIATIIDKANDAAHAEEQAKRVYQSFQKAFFNEKSGLYVDGEGSGHSSLHANMYALVFGLVPEEKKPKIIEFIKSKGMACSVYGVQYLLEALYQENEADYALDLMTDTSDRSWWNMIKAGSSITLEAWDIKYKKNLDWNHAWGAAPANIIPRQTFGIQPTKPGFEEFQVKIQPGYLTKARIKKPTPKGPIICSYKVSGKKIEINLKIPEQCTASVYLPLGKTSNRKYIINGTEKKGELYNGYVLFKTNQPDNKIQYEN